MSGLFVGGSAGTIGRVRLIAGVVLSGCKQSSGFIAKVFSIYQVVTR